MWGKLRMKFGEAGRNCMSPAGPPTTKLSSLLSRLWLSPRTEVQGLLWLWLVPVGTHSHTSR